MRRLPVYLRSAPAATIAAVLAGASLGAFAGMPRTPAPIVQITRVSPPLPWVDLPPLEFGKPVAHVPETVGGAWLAISASDYYADQNPARRKYPKFKEFKKAGGKRQKKDND